MTLKPTWHLNFLIYEENIILCFISVLSIYAQLPLSLLSPEAVLSPPSLKYLRFRTHLPPPPPPGLINYSFFFLYFKSIFRENRGRLYTVQYIVSLIKKCGLGRECYPSSYREQIYYYFSVLFGYPTLSIPGFARIFLFSSNLGIWWQRRGRVFSSFLNFS
jgi:hypothetical protein